MHALAHALNTTTADIERWSAREFNERLAWMDAEQIGPFWERARHAQLLAAIANGACERTGGGMFSAKDFLPEPQDQDAPEAGERTAEEIAEEFRRRFAAMDWAGAKGMQ